MTPEVTAALHKHIKHAIIWIVVLAVLYAAFRIDADRRLKTAQLDAETKVKVAQNQVIVAQAQQVKQVAVESNTSIDQLHSQQITDLQRRLATVPDAATISAIVKASLPGSTTTTGANGAVTIATTADAINRADVAFKSCQFDRDDCLKKQVNFQTIIAEDVKIKAADDSTITQQNKDLIQLRKTQVPPWWFGVGLSKQPGAFNQPGSYQAVGMVGRRLIGPVGIAAVAQNRSVGLMVTYNFGGKK